MSSLLAFQPHSQAEKAASFRAAFRLPAVALGACPSHPEEDLNDNGQDPQDQRHSHAEKTAVYPIEAPVYLLESLIHCIEALPHQLFKVNNLSAHPANLGTDVPVKVRGHLHRQEAPLLLPQGRGYVFHKDLQDPLRFLFADLSPPAMRVNSSASLIHSRLLGV